MQNAQRLRAGAGRRGSRAGRETGRFAGCAGILGTPRVCYHEGRANRAPLPPLPRRGLRAPAGQPAGRPVLRRAFECVAAVIALGAGLGCSNLDRFTTGAGEAYCGAVIIGAPFRAGLSPRVQMRLTLDAGAIDGPSAPGTISTFEAADVGQPEERTFAESPLRPIPALAHDALSHLDFGDGRERSAIFAVSPADEAAEAMLAVVSLRTDDTVEVRILRAGLAPSATAPTPATRRQVFGLFSLTRQPNRCGF